MSSRFLPSIVAAVLSQVLIVGALHADAPQPRSPGVTRVACVGDSITVGAGVAQREANCYPAVLGQLLGGKCEVRNFGVSGATLLKNGDKPYWKQKAFETVTEFQPNVVIVKLGTNDTKPQNWKHKDEFAGDLRAMVGHFASLPSKPRVWLCLPVPVYKTNFGINQAALDKILPMVRDVAKEQDAPVIDLFTALSGHPEFFPDGIHPNASGAALMAKTIDAALAEKAAKAD